jgi:putative ABC transport system permease protein
MVSDFVSSLQIEGRLVADSDRPTTNFYAVSPGYFAAMRIPLVRGRLVSDEDRRGATRVAVINQSMADRLFAGVEPIGRRIKVSQGNDDWRQIVGIVGDVKQYGLSERTPNQVYEPYLQHPYFSGFSLVVRTTVPDPGAVVPELRGILKTLDRELPLGRVRTLDEVVGATIRPQRFSTVLIGIFSASALLLAAIGIYGVVSYTVGLRTQEFAIRVAHGATRRDILALVLRGAAWMAGIGVLGGYLVAWLMRRSVEGLLFGVDPGDWPTYVAVAAILATVSLLASVVPALRATRVDPMTALRQ